MKNTHKWTSRFVVQYKDNGRWRDSMYGKLNQIKQPDIRWFKYRLIERRERVVGK